MPQDNLPPLRIREVDGSPNVIPVFDVILSNNLSLQNNGGGIVTISATTGAGGSSQAPITFPLIVGSGGTGQVTITSNRLLMGAGTAPITVVPNPLDQGEFYVGSDTSLIPFNFIIGGQGQVLSVDSSQALGLQWINSNALGSSSSVQYAATGNNYVVMNLAGDLTNEYRLVQSGNSITITTDANTIVINAVTNGAGSGTPTFPEVAENNILVTSSARVFNFIDSNVEVSGTTSANIYHNLPYICQGRLTVISGSAITITQSTSAKTLYFTPYNGDKISIYDGTRWVVNSFNEISLSLSACSANTNYDVFISNATTILLSSAWTTDTARSRPLDFQNGVYVNSGVSTQRYLGTIRAGSATSTEDFFGGTTTQIGGKRFVWNYYNQAPRQLVVIDTATSWSYTTAAWRQANNNSGNMVEYVIGNEQATVEANVIHNISISGNTSEAAATGIGVDSLTVNSAIKSGGFNGNAQQIQVILKAVFQGSSGLGYHYLSWLEAGADTTSIFLGGVISDTDRSSGLQAVLNG